MSEQGTLVKAKPSITGNKMNTKQYLLSILTALFDLKMLTYSKLAMVDEKYGLFVFYITLGIAVSAITYYCIKDELVWYRITNKIDFLQRWIRRSDFIYKYNEKKTSDTQLNEHVKVRRAEEPVGLIWFNKCKTYDNNYCNTGIAFILNPSGGVGDIEYNNILLTFVCSLKKDTVNKFHYLTSKVRNNIARGYEELLKGELKPEIRSGIVEAKKYLQRSYLKTRPAHYMFIGLGYYTWQQRNQAIQDAENTAAAYQLFLEYAGIECRQIKSKKEYIIIHNQFDRMENLGVLTVD